MPSADPVMANETTLEALQSRPGAVRRPRPPTLDLSTPEENRIPLRNDRVNRRESRLGLRNIFGRSKVVKDVEGPLSPTQLARSAGARTSVAQPPNWPYPHEPLQSQTTLSESPSRPLSMALESPGQTAHQSLDTVTKRRTPTSRTSHQPRDNLARWDQPPLFKAYPQAIRHGTLPATALSGDAILRIHEKHGESTNETAEGDQGKEKAKAKRKPRRNTSLSNIKLGWTTKIFVLVTSGYLLQYSSEGEFDRLPEKVLHLGKTSAAFASDIIPGRHWVLQVSAAAAAAEQEDSSSSESRSLFSRLTFRSSAVERRRASNFLLVFENARDMEDWLATLRREIENLGGKKKLSETGKPKAEDETAQLREQPSQRTLVVRDPDRYSNVPDDFSWRRGSEAPTESEASVVVIDSDMTPSLDDMSTTNSVISHDGRQLDALRDSGHRLSFISSGQRTIVTSAGSSPACSPTADVFPSHSDELRPSFEARARPNASSIVDRRKSLQTMSPFVELNGTSSPGSRPQSTFMAATRAEVVASPTGSHQAPNFSVPHSSNRRFSYVKVSTPDSETLPASPFRDNDPLLRLAGRKSPPKSLRGTRPLSMVADQPSPREDVLPERPATGHGEPHQPPPQYERPSLPSRTSSRNSALTSQDLPSRRSSLMPTETSARPVLRSSPRRLASMGALRTQEDVAPRMRTFKPSEARGQPRLATSLSGETDRSHSSMGMYGGGRSQSPLPSQLSKRASMYTVLPDRSSRGSMHTPYTTETLPLGTPPPSGPLPPIPGYNKHRSRVDMKSRPIYNRRSMPQLVEGPPPAPPPTCALPPIPQKLLLRS